MEDRGAIVIVDDTPTNLEVLVGYLTDSGFDVYVATNGEEALKRIPLVSPDLVLLDVMMPGLDGFETCRRLKADPETRDIPVIFMTALSETEEKVRGFSAGAVDYVTKPIRQEEVLARIRTHLTLRRQEIQLAEANRLLEERVRERTRELMEALAEVERLKERLEAENRYLREEIGGARRAERIVGGSSGPFATVLRNAQQVAVTDATVLLLGETGTGKELVARAIHEASTRSDRALVRVNCAALPDTLIESELFGHEKGAFTGALARKLGRFELAHQGTLFLDEIGDLPLSLQAKLLRVLQEGELERLGSTETIRVDVRVIAATNRDLKRDVADGRFREDLFYRLDVFPIRLPPLRERPDDVPELVQHLVDKHARRMGRQIDEVTDEVMAALTSYPWPGNVRELENVIERGVIMSRGTTLTAGDWVPTPQAAAEPVDGASRSLDEVQRAHILSVLRKTGWRVSGDRGAARVLGLKPTTLEARMKKLGIRRPER